MATVMRNSRNSGKRKESSDKSSKFEVPKIGPSILKVLRTPQSDVPPSFSFGFTGNFDKASQGLEDRDKEEITPEFFRFCERQGVDYTNVKVTFPELPWDRNEGEKHISRYVVPSMEELTWAKFFPRTDWSF